MSDNETPFETVTVAKLEVEPGDFLVVQSQDLEQAQAVKEQLEALFPEAHVIAIPSGIQMHVVRQIDRTRNLEREFVKRSELTELLRRSDAQPSSLG